MLTGNNGILQRVADAKTETEKAQIIENAQADILAQQTKNKSVNITKEQLTTILNKYFEEIEPNIIPNEVSSTSDIELTTTDEKYTINLSKIFKGKFADENKVITLGEKYQDSWIGRKIEFTSNSEEGTWIILGKDENGDILITQTNPIGTYTSGWGENQAELFMGNLSFICGYSVDMMQSVQIDKIQARSIKKSDIEGAIATTEENKEYIFADGSDYWVAEIIDVGPQVSAMYVGNNSIYNSQMLYSSTQYTGSKSRTCKTRIVVVLSSSIPYNDVKDLIGDYAQY